MTTAPRLGLLLSLCLLTARAEDVPWQTLFNGTDLSGWHIVGPSEPAPVTVEDGAIVLRQRRNTLEHTFATSDARYGDFILELDLLDEPGFNTGILLRCADAPADARVRLNGYQVKIDPTSRAWTGGVFDDFGHNWKWLYDLRRDARARAAFKLGEWAHFRIECLGNTIKVWVNGVPTCYLVDEKYASGYIAFKDHSVGDLPSAGKNAVHIKNIRIITDRPERFAQPIDLDPRRAPPVADATDGDIRLPDGFRATIVADNLMAGRKGDTLRFLALDTKPNSDLYAISRKGGIFALRDTDGDGRADMIREFGAGGGTGLAVRNGYLYYSSASAVYRYKLTPGELVPSGPPELIAQLPEQKSHDAKSFAFDEDDNLYVDVGSPLNVTAEPDRAFGAKGIDPTELQKRHGGIWRFKADVPNQDQLKDGYRYASGLRHILSLAWNPTRKAFYAVMMGRDQLSTVAPQFYSDHDNAELPAEEMHLLHDQSDLGWPTTYYDPIKRARFLAPEYGGDGVKKPEPGRFADPILAFPAHWAPLQMAFNTTQQFPDHYHQGAFIAFHGSWNRAPEAQRGYLVAFVPFGPDGLPSGGYEIFADGFAGTPDLKRPGDARFRACGLAFGPDGTLYIGDTEKGRIWRITYTGEHRTTVPVAAATPIAATVEQYATPEAARNAGVYKMYCAACHMDDGSGVSGMQPSLRDSTVLRGDVSQLIRVVLNGPAAVLPADRTKYANAMPAFNVLSDADLAAVLTHARERFGPGAGPVTPAEIAAVRAGK
jgi:glucose/arabinose dehydrogenase/mono/diheme cytochrome c family protein